MKTPWLLQQQLYCNKVIYWDSNSVYYRLKQEKASCKHITILNFQKKELGSRRLAQFLLRGGKVAEEFQTNYKTPDHNFWVLPKGSIIISNDKRLKKLLKDNYMVIPYGFEVKKIYDNFLTKSELPLNF